MSDMSEAMDDLRTSIARRRAQSALYFVKCDFGPRIGHSWIERHVNETGRSTLINDLIGGQIENPLQILEADPTEGTCRDVTEDVAKALADWSASKCEPLHRPLIDFIHDNAGAAWTRSLRVA